MYYFFPQNNGQTSRVRAGTVPAARDRTGRETAAHTIGSKTGECPMARRWKPNGTGIPCHGAEAPARILLPKIQALFESEEGQREFAEWKAQQEQDKAK